MLIASIDPGLDRGGVCLYDTDACKVVLAKEFSLKQPKEKVPINLLTARMQAFVDDNSAPGDVFGPEVAHVYIEDQMFKKQLIVVQAYLNAAVGGWRSTVVSAQAVKNHFGAHFPHVDGASSQHNVNKTNAVALGKLIAGNAVNNNISAGVTGKRKHDVYDAIVLARYAADVLVPGAPYAKKVKGALKVAAGGRRKRGGGGGGDDDEAEGKQEVVVDVDKVMTVTDARTGRRSRVNVKSKKSATQMLKNISKAYSSAAPKGSSGGGGGGRAKRQKIDGAQQKRMLLSGDGKRQTAITSLFATAATK